MKFKNILFLVVLLTELLFSQNNAQNAEISNLIDIISNHENFEGSAAQLFGAKFSPLNRDIISFYRQVSDYRQLWIFDKKRKSFTQISTISTKLSENDLLDFDSRETNYLEDEIDWSPVKIKGKQWFAFVSAGEYSNWDLYLGELGSNQFIKLTSNKAVDYQPKWGPDGDRIVFVSSRSGNGDIYLIDNIHQLVNQYYLKRYNSDIENKLLFDISDKLEKEIYSSSSEDEVRIIQVTNNDNEELYPVFSPTGKFIALTSKDYDDKILNYGISLIDLDGYNSPKRFTTSTKTESRPVWTNDEKYIIYYSSSDIDDSKKDIYVSKFEKVGEVGNRTKIIAQAVLSSGSQPPTLTFNKENNNAVLYNNYDPLNNSYNVRVASLNGNDTKLIYSQKSFIESSACFNNTIIVTRQIGDNYSIGINYSNNLQTPYKYNKFWFGEVSKSKTMYYYIGGGALGAAGIVLWLLSDDETKDQIIKQTLGVPRPPRIPSNN